MSDGIKRLAGETVIYGLSTILGRLINWLLMPVLYVRTNAIYENGAVSEILAFTATLLVLFTYGLETGFFRFSKDGKEKDVFKTSITMLLTTSSLLIILTFIFAPSLNNFLGGGKYLSSIYFVGITIALDAFLSIPFAKLRLQNRAIKFVIIKLFNIVINVLLNLFFLVLIPDLIQKNLLSQSIVDFYNSFDNVYFIFLSTLIASVLQFIFFIPEFKNIQGKFDIKIAKQMLIYSWPVLLVGLTGMIIQNSDKILMSKLVANGLSDTGLYGVNFKIGVLMSLYTQSFRFAFEPFFFKKREQGIKK
jgi:O-antigen/teichoic acid export membrane protein